MSLIRFGIALATALCLSMSAQAQEPAKIRFTLDWKYQGLHAYIFWAKDKGYFAKEGLDVSIDQGTGSSATITRIASGTYDAGFGDMNAIIQMAGTKPGQQPVMVYMIYNTPPFALIVKKDSPIKSLKDLEGKKMGTPAGGAAGVLFAALAKTNGIDADKVPVVNMQPQLQEQMLVKGDVDFSAIFTVTSYANLIGMKMDPLKDFRWFYYSDYGIDLYSNGIMVSKALITEKPKAVEGLVRALNKAMIEVAANPAAGVKEMLKVEPLMDANIETQRLEYALKTHFVSKETDANGLGDVSDARMEKSIKLLVDTYKLPNTPAVKDVFDRSFLPPKAERTLKLSF
ncbi:MAG TPA: ABC transporter substrate-binding protein [Pseudolabrys sp.]|nr:ABC transporter substrate-binding protein [Pseudolabrys sp.]